MIKIKNYINYTLYQPQLTIHLLVTGNYQFP